jgi:hypothetical protein
MTAMTPTKKNEKEDYGSTGQPKEKQLPGEDGMKPPHGGPDPDPAPDEDDTEPSKTDRNRQPEEAVL